MYNPMINSKELFGNKANLRCAKINPLLEKLDGGMFWKTWWGGCFMIFLQNFSSSKISGMSAKKWRQIAPLIPYKKLQEGAPKETKHIFQPQPVFSSYILLQGDFPNPQTPGLNVPWETPTRNQNYHRPNDAQLCRRSGTSYRNKKTGIYPWKWTAGT